MTGVTFRSATTADAAAIAKLVNQLGYPTTPVEMETRITRLLAQPDYATQVAELSGEIVGMVGACVGYALEFDSTYGRLTGLVVEERSRGRGIGRVLMLQIERWLRERGATALTLTSGKQRTEAHKFYESIGYKMTGLRFAKQL